MGIVDQLVEKVSQILDPEQLNQVLSMDEFEEEIKAFQPSMDINWKPVFAGMGIEAVREYALDEGSEIALPKGKKQLLMDESEAQKHLVKKHRARTIKYYELILKYLIGFARTSNVDIREWFFNNYFEQIAAFCEHPEFRLPFF